MIKLENLHLYKHKTISQLICEQMQTGTKYDTIFKTFNTENTFYRENKNENNAACNIKTYYITDSRKKWLILHQKPGDIQRNSNSVRNILEKH